MGIFTEELCIALMETEFFLLQNKSTGEAFSTAPEKPS